MANVSQIAPKTEKIGEFEMKAVNSILDFLMNTWVVLVVLIALVAFLGHGVYQEYQLRRHPEAQWQIKETPDQRVEQAEKVAPVALPPTIVEPEPAPKPVEVAPQAQPISRRISREDVVKAYVAFILSDNPKVKVETAQQWASSYFDNEEVRGLKHGIMPAIGHVESRHKPSAKSKKDAHGLVQIQRETGRYWADREGIRHQPKARKAKGEKDLIWVISKPDINIRLGAKVLDVYLKEANGDLDQALSRYSGGAVDYARKVRATHERILDSILNG